MEFETPEDVEDQDPVGYWAAEVVKGVGLPFILLQYSPTEMSPCSKARNEASSRRARASALPRNCASSASQASRAVQPRVLTMS